MEITIVRKFVAILAILAFFAGMEQIISNWPMEYQGTISGIWLTFLNVAFLLWLIVTFLAVISIAAEIKDRQPIQMISFGIWLVLLTVTCLDMTNHPVIPVNMTWDENIRIGMLFFLVPGLILSDLEHQFSQK